jgi:ABC-type glycerol-3-phosphate transport system substrate-binding protein
MTRKKRAIAAALLGAGLLAGCGGGSGATGGATSTPTTTDACAAMTYDAHHLDVPNSQYETDRAACWDVEDHEKK